MRSKRNKVIIHLLISSLLGFYAGVQLTLVVNVKEKILCNTEIKKEPLVLPQHDTKETILRITEVDEDKSQPKKIYITSSAAKEPVPVNCTALGLIRMDDIEIDEEEPHHEYSRIPKIVHQTGASRCVTPVFASLMKKWQLPGYSYRFFDDDAVDEFLNRKWPVFPHLNQVVRCIRKTAKADVWRYLILWEYGGIYSDMDNIPTGFNSTTILPDDDGFFAIETGKVLSQYFMAVSPRHPLIYYTIQYALINIIRATDIGKLDPAYATGPEALFHGMEMFMLHSKSEKKTCQS